MNGVRRPGQGNGWPVKGQGRRTLQTTAARSIPMPPRDPAPPCHQHLPESHVIYALIGGLMLVSGLALFVAAITIAVRLNNDGGKHR